MRKIILIALVMAFAWAVGPVAQADEGSACSPTGEGCGEVPEFAETVTVAGACTDDMDGTYRTITTTEYADGSPSTMTFEDTYDKACDFAPSAKAPEPAKVASNDIISFTG